MWPRRFPVAEGIGQNPGTTPLRPPKIRRCGQSWNENDFVSGGRWAFVATAFDQSSFSRSACTYLGNLKAEMINRNISFSESEYKRVFSRLKKDRQDTFQEKGWLAEHWSLTEKYLKQKTTASSIVPSLASGPANDGTDGSRSSKLTSRST